MRRDALGPLLRVFALLLALFLCAAATAFVHERGVGAAALIGAAALGVAILWLRARRAAGGREDGA